MGNVSIKRIKGYRCLVKSLVFIYFLVLKKIMKCLFLVDRRGSLLGYVMLKGSWFLVFISFIVSYLVFLELFRKVEMNFILVILFVVFLYGF